jgi:cytoskeletal protein CcmA (bactofilin family)
MNSAQSTNVIAQGTVITGNLVGDEGFEIEGQVAGTVRSAHGRVSIGREARVKADITAVDVVVAGRMDGDIRATGKVELRGGAVMMGNIYAARFSMEEDAVFRGTVDPSRANEETPSPHADRAAVPSQAHADVFPSPYAEDPSPFGVHRMSAGARPSILVPQTVAHEDRAATTLHLPAALAVAAAKMSHSMDGEAAYGVPGQEAGE